MRRAAIITALRTPIGRYGGALASVRPDDLAALVIGEVIKRSGIDPATVEDVYFGAANQAGEDNRNVARMAALLAGLPETVPGCTVNRLCASGLEAINIAARMIETGHGDVMIAGGVESMSRAPFVVAKPQAAFDRNAEMYDTTIGWRFTNPKLAEMFYPYSMGETAENIFEEMPVTREEQDAFALQSHQRALAAIDSGRSAEEIVPVEVPQRKGDPLLVEVDERPRRDTSLQALAKLRPAFRGNGTVTAGNASGINDGAAAVLMMSADKAKETLGLGPGPRASGLWVQID